MAGRLWAAASLLVAVASAGCATVETPKPAVAPASVLGYAATPAAHFDPERQPVLIRIFKEESELEVWRRGRDGSYALLKSFPICAWSGALGPKRKDGDRQAPEGFYSIVASAMNPTSQYRKSFDLGYPNAYDRSQGATGRHLMVHGSCRSAGCYAMDDRQIEEIYALVGRSFSSGAASVQIQAMPFRMTPAAMARHARSPHIGFWRMLKRGSDLFETTRRPVPAGECGGAYSFGSSTTTGGRCGAAPETAEALARRLSDESEEKRIAATLAPKDLAAAPAVRWAPGIQADPAAYAAEQNRRDGYDVDGNPVVVEKTGVFSRILAGTR